MKTSIWKKASVAILTALMILCVGIVLFPAHAEDDATDIRDLMKGATINNATNVSEDSLEIKGNAGTDWFSVNFAAAERNTLMRFNFTRPAGKTDTFHLYLCARSEAESPYYNGQKQYYIQFGIKENSFYYFPFANYGSGDVNVKNSSGGNAGGETEGRLDTATIEYGVRTSNGKPEIVLKVTDTATGTVMLDFSVVDESADAETAIAGGMLRLVASGAEMGENTLLLRSAKGGDAPILPEHSVTNIEDAAQRESDIVLLNATNASEDNELLLRSKNTDDWFGASFPVTETSGGYRLRYRIENPEQALRLGLRYGAADHYNRDDYHALVYFNHKAVYLYDQNEKEDSAAAGIGMPDATFAAGDIVEIEFGAAESAGDTNAFLVFRMGKVEGDGVTPLAYSFIPVGKMPKQEREFFRVYFQNGGTSAEIMGVDRNIFTPDPTYEPTNLEDVFASATYTNARNVSNDNLQMKSLSADWQSVSFGGTQSDRNAVLRFRYRRTDDHTFFLNARAQNSSQYYEGQPEYAAMLIFEGAESKTFRYHIYRLEGETLKISSAPVLAEAGGIPFSQGTTATVEFGVVSQNGKPVVIFKVYDGDTVFADVCYKDIAAAETSIPGNRLQIVAANGLSPVFMGAERDINPLPTYTATDIAEIAGEGTYSNARNISKTNIQLEAAAADQGWMSLNFGGQQTDRNRVLKFRYTKEETESGYPMFLAARSETASQWYDGQKQYMVEFSFQKNVFHYFIKKIDGTKGLSNAEAVSLTYDTDIPLENGAEVMITFGVVTTAAGKPAVILKVENGNDVLADVCYTDTEAAETAINGNWIRVVASAACSPVLKGAAGDITPLPVYDATDLENLCEEDKIQILNAQNLSARNELELRRKGGGAYGFAMPMPIGSDVVRFRMEMNDVNAQIRLGVRSPQATATIRGDDYHALIMFSDDVVFLYNRKYAPNPDSEDTPDATYPISRKLNVGEVVTVEFGAVDVGEKTQLVFFLYDEDGNELAGGFQETDRIEKAEGQFFRAFLLGQTDIAFMGYADTVYENFVPQPFEGGISYITDRTQSAVYDANEIVNAEDLVEQYGYKTFINNYAQKLENGDVKLNRMSPVGDRMGLVKIAPKGIIGDYATRFKVKYEGENFSIAIESMADLENGNTWSKDNNYYTEISIGETMSRVVQYYDGFNFAGGYEFRDAEQNFEVPDVGEYVFVEFGCYRSSEDFKTLRIYVRVYTEDGELDRFMETEFTGNYAADFNSWFKIYNIHGGSDVVVSGIEAGLLSKYEFERELAEGFVIEEDGSFSFAATDISSLVPMSANGVLYTKSEDRNARNQSLINFAGLEENPVVKLKITFTGENFGAILTMRAAGGWDTDGYFFKLDKDGVTLTNAPALGTVQADFAFESGKSYVLEMGCIDFYYTEEGSVVPDGVFLYLKIDGALVVSSYMDKNAAIKTGNLLSGVIEGDIGSTLAISPVEFADLSPELTVTAQRDSVDLKKTIRLSFANSMPTAFDRVSYEIVSGEKYAKVDERGILSGLKNGTVRVRVAVSNEYGTFYSDTLEITVGTGKDPTGAIIGGCVGGAVGIAAIGTGIWYFLKKKKKAV